MSQPLDLENGNIAASMAGEFVDAAAGGPDASHKVARLLVLVGFTTMVLDLLTAFYREPSVVVVFKSHKLAYYLTLAGIFALGMAEVITAFCLSRYRSSSGRVFPEFARAVLCISVMPLVGVIALSGFAVFMKS